MDSHCTFSFVKENCENILHEGEIEILKFQEEIGDHLTPYWMQYNFLGKEADSMELEYQAKSKKQKKLKNAMTPLIVLYGFQNFLITRVILDIQH